MTAPSTQPQRTKLILMLEERGVLDVDDQRWLCAQHTGRPLTSRRDLTSAEAHTFIERLAGLTEADLLGVLSRRCDCCQTAVPTGRLCCAEHQAKMCPPCHEREHPPTPTSGPADSGAAGRRTTTRSCETPVPVAGHGPAAPTSAPIGTDPVEVAAQAAADRYRARGGVVPDPPAAAEIPARVPVVLGPAPDRSCPPNICWCGGLGPDPLPGACPQWKPRPEPNWARVPGSLTYVDSSWAP